MKQENSKSINEKDYVTLYKCGNYKEIVCCRQDTKPIQITKLTKNQYIDNNTGEIKEYHYTGNKTLNNIRKQFKNIPRLIKGYFDGNNTERFITLTYSYIMSNPYCLSYDFKKFIRKINRRYGKCRYIYICLRRIQGALHLSAKGQGHFKGHRSGFHRRQAFGGLHRFTGGGRKAARVVSL